MSILDFPRFHFRGFARANVPTANRSIHKNIDIATNTVYMNGKPFDLAMPPTDFHAHLKQLGPRFNAEGKPDPDGIFSQATGHNACGNNHFSWENVRITGVQLAVGPINKEDELVGTKLALWGHYNDYLRTTFNRARWVDNDPTQVDTATIYAGQFTLSDKDATPSSPLMFTADINQTHSARWVGAHHIAERSAHFLDDEFSRTRLFQFSVPKEDPYLLFNSQGVLPASLRYLQQALEDGNVLGLTVQYSLINMSTPSKPDSPVFYDLVGTIGLWYKNELATYPSGRLLLPQNTDLGPIMVKVHADWLSLNMPISIPFTTREASAVADNHPTHRLGAKFPLGNLTLKSQSGALIAHIPEQQYLDFWHNNGVLDVPLLNRPDDSLILVSDKARWTETDWLVQSDSNNISLEAPDKLKDKTYPKTISIRSYYRGEPAQHPALDIRVQNPELIETQVEYSTQTLGHAELTLNGRLSGATRVLLGEAGSEQDIGVRVLPDDWHLDEVPAAEVDYAFLYKHVMGYYELVYPFMADKVFSLADSCKCETYARLMWQMCDPENRDKSYYMPSTRELSLPKSKLFLKYLANVEASVKASDALHAEQTVITSKVQLIDELKKAVDLELSIMLQYIYAANSIPNYAQGEQLVQQGRWNRAQLALACGASDRRRNSGFRGTLLEIAHEEMIHYLVVNNLLMALGEPFYAGSPVIGQQAQTIFGLDTEFSFEPFSEHVLARFVRFEWPNFISSPGKSIADFYASIRQAFCSLPNLFDGVEGKRSGEHHLFLNELTNRAFPGYQLEVYDTKSALFGIDFVVEQGEGGAVDAPHFESSHFQRLRNMSAALTAQKIPFEPALHVLKNPVLEEREGCIKVVDAKARALMKLYQGCYELMFLMMAQHFAQSPLGSLRRSRLMNSAIDVMTGLLRPLSATLMNMPSGIPGRNAAPPIPEPISPKVIADYSLGCQMLAKKCRALADYAINLETGLVGKAQLEMLEFYYQHLTDLAQGKITKEA
ncbi:iminophenyl-pyruvate dimer synthase VioB [Chitinimonas sp. BJB300]|uniref:iminophenyl-pyruvate dimer synthase VioB n=1 Tax=Chitinimonas sp. BJB300 TaxID=1559339 RepID=UPI000C0ED9E4|nr:iminophenyl-pyruvate dimer synthase VioB [Chitinimonas sp. BJB300]PHV13488.1 iminophenyl-pyruvate dimer synthase VioB [Chitinimonas sp. BJB300]TSJ89827.1 iminophenyl-pyruvate dimer synthase VioB [Chitinimonas sp. BJB300]